MTEESKEEIRETWEQVDEMFEETINSLKNNDMDLAKKVLKREEIINDLQLKIKQTHAVRVSEGNSTLSLDFNIVELIDNLEKIGDRLTNLAQSVLIKMQWKLDKEDYYVVDNK